MQALKYEIQQDNSREMNFVNFLPLRLKMELSVEIHKGTILHIPFFKNKSLSFIAFIGPLLKK